MHVLCSAYLIYVVSFDATHSCASSINQGLHTSKLSLYLPCSVHHAITQPDRILQSVQEWW
jgi:hypothetical protein